MDPWTEDGIGCACPVCGYHVGHEYDCWMCSRCTRRDGPREEDDRDTFLCSGCTQEDAIAEFGLPPRAWLEEQRARRRGDPDGFCADCGDALDEDLHCRACRAESRIEAADAMRGE